jgi:hypothetical protein
MQWWQAKLCISWWRYSNWANTKSGNVTSTGALWHLPAAGTCLSLGTWREKAMSDFINKQRGWTNDGKQLFLYLRFLIFSITSNSPWTSNREKERELILKIGLHFWNSNSISVGIVEWTKSQATHTPHPTRGLKTQQRLTRNKISNEVNCKDQWQSSFGLGLPCNPMYLSTSSFTF